MQLQDLKLESQIRNCEHNVACLEVSNLTVKIMSFPTAMNFRHTGLDLVINVHGAEPLQLVNLTQGALPDLVHTR